jgi:hypothetical protein
MGNTLGNVTVKHTLAVLDVKEKLRLVTGTRRNSKNKEETEFVGFCDRDRSVHVVTSIRVLLDSIEVFCHRDRDNDDISIQSIATTFIFRKMDPLYNGKNNIDIEYHEFNSEKIRSIVSIYDCKLFKIDMALVPKDYTICIEQLQRFVIENLGLYSTVWTQMYQFDKVVQVGLTPEGCAMALHEFPSVLFPISSCTVFRDRAVIVSNNRRGCTVTFERSRAGQMTVAILCICFDVNQLWNISEESCAAFQSKKFLVPSLEPLEQFLHEKPMNGSANLISFE